MKKDKLIKSDWIRARYKNERFRDHEFITYTFNVKYSQLVDFDFSFFDVFSLNGELYQADFGTDYCPDEDKLDIYKPHAIYIEGRAEDIKEFDLIFKLRCEINQLVKEALNLKQNPNLPLASFCTSIMARMAEYAPTECLDPKDKDHIFEIGELLSEKATIKAFELHAKQRDKLTKTGSIPDSILSKLALKF